MADKRDLFARPSTVEMDDAWNSLKRTWGRVKDAGSALMEAVPAVDMDDPSVLPNQQLAGEGMARMGRAFLAVQPTEEDLPVIGNMPDGTPMRFDPTAIGGIVGSIKKVGKAAAKKATKSVAKEAALDMSEAARMARAEKMGFDTGKTYYHGTKADIDAFDPNALGASTNAGSARQGYFFASDASTAGDYADLSPGRTALRASAGDDAAEELTSLSGMTKLSREEELASLKRSGPAETQKYLDMLRKSQTHLSDILGGRVVEKFPRPRDYLEQKLVEYEEKIRGVESQLSPRAEKLRQKKIADLEEQVRQFKKLEDEKHTGQNVLPVHLKTKNPYVHDFKGEAYRDTSYSDIMKAAKEKGHDSVIFKNTFDPGNPENRVMQDIVAVFEPNQIRSKFAAFDPKKKNSGNLSAAIGGVGLLGAGALSSSSEAQASELMAPPTRDEYLDFMKSKPGARRAPE